MLGALVSLRAWSQQPLSNTTSHQVILRVSEVAIIGLQDARPLELTLDLSGASVPSSDARSTGTKKIFYTVVNAPGITRNILVHWAESDAAPAGTSLRIRAVSIPASCGIANGEVTVSSHPQALICAIPTCATGTGDGGVELQYRFIKESFSRAAAETQKSVTITFTVSDDY